MNRKSQRRRTQFTPENLQLLALAEAAGIRPAQLLNQSLREHLRQTPAPDAHPPQKPSGNGEDSPDQPAGA